MARKTSKNTRNTRAPRSQVSSDPARTLWLAGLGAMSAARKRGGELLQSFVNEGEELRERGETFAGSLMRDLRRAASDARKQVVGTISPLQEQVLRTARDVQADLGQRVGVVLDRLGVSDRFNLSALIGVKARATKRRKPTLRAKRTLRGKRRAA